MLDTAEAHSHTLTTNRNCTIEFTNRSSTFCLYNPNVYMDSGFPFSPPQPTIRSSNTELCSFIKDDHTASGAVGVMTYQLFNMHMKDCNELVAVMFSVPFDYNIYKNWLGFGIFSDTTACDESLYKKMYNNKTAKEFVLNEANGSAMIFHGQKVEIRGTMSDEGKAIVKLELYDKV